MNARPIPMLALLALSAPLTPLAPLAPLTLGAVRPGFEALSAADARTEQPVHAKRIALLVGIDQYAPGTPASFGRLDGCVRDVRLVEKLLVERFGFARDDVLVLADADATHEKIVQSFDRFLVARADAATEVVFWYSGHGSRTPDASGKADAEMDGKDETLVAYDSRTGGADGARDVSDDELRSLLLALSLETQRVLVVTDSCHSGGVTRGAERRSRSAAEGTRPVDLEALRKSFWPKDVPLYDDGEGPVLETKRPVHIAACSPRETAQEIDVVEDDGSHAAHGALTFHLVACLARAQPGATYRSIADEAAVRLAANGCAQTPWYEGPLDRTLFAGEFAARPAGFLAHKTGEGGAKIAVEAGTLFGLRAGSTLEIRDRTSAKKLGLARVERAAALTCTAAWTSDGPVPEGAFSAVEVSRPAGVEPLALFVEEPVLRAKLSAFELARLVASVSSGAEYRVVGDGEHRFALFAPGDLCLWKGELRSLEHDGDRLANELKDALQKEVGYRALLALAQETGTIAIQASFVAASDEEIAKIREQKLSKRCEGVQPRAGRSAGRAFEVAGSEDMGELLRFVELELKNTSDTDVHIAVLSVSEDRARNLIYPSQGERDNVLSKRATKRIPVGVTILPSWPKGVPMHDRYLVLATRESADLSPFVSGSQLRSSGDPHVPEIVQQALLGPATRGLKNVSSERASYGIATCELLVER